MPVYYHTSRYRLIDLAGQGQYGHVYVAVNRQTSQLVAFKVLNPQRLPTRGFLRELNFLLTLQHPNVVRCDSLDYLSDRRPRKTQEHHRCLVMDYCVGGNLRALLEQEGVLPLPLALEFTVDILAALDYAHQRKIIHCDLKPENILLEPTNQGWRAQVSDFGVARLVEDKESAGHTGSPAYMAPERFYGQPLPASDLYSVGILLYEMVVGSRPFSGTPGELMSAHISQPFNIPSSLPMLLKSILIKALDKFPRRRYQTAAEMAHSVQLLLDITQSDPEYADQLNILLYPPQWHWSERWLPRGQLTLPKPGVLLTQAGEWVYGALGDRLWAWRSNDNGSIATREWQLPGEIIHLCPGQLGCWLTIETEPVQLCWVQEGVIPLPISLEPPRHTQVAIDPSGSWCIQVQQKNPESHDNQLTLHLHALASVDTRKLQLDLAPEEVLTTAIALNQRYGLVVTRQPNPLTTNLYLFNRKGQKILDTGLPFGLSLVTPALANPWTLFAWEERETPILVILYLRPWRIQRVALNFRPQQICPTPWGCIIANAHRLTLLTNTGEIIGGLEVTDPVLKIAFTGDRQLWLITQTQQEHHLQWLDITDLNLDFIF